MAYGRTSMKVFLIVIAVIAVLVVGGYLFLRLAVPNIIAAVISNPDSSMMEQSDRQAITEASNRVLAVLERYGLGREEAIEELRKIRTRDFTRAWEAFSASPPQSAGEASRFALSELDIRGVDRDALASDVDGLVSPGEYRRFIESEEFARIDSQFLGLMFPVFRDSAVAFLEAQE